MPKSFKILTHKSTHIHWAHQDAANVTLAPAYVVYFWCRRRKRFRLQKTPLAIGVPYESWYRWGGRERRGWIDINDGGDYAHFGKELAAQNGLVWIDQFDPQWKMQDVVLLRLKGKI